MRSTALEPIGTPQTGGKSEEEAVPSPGNRYSETAVAEFTPAPHIREFPCVGGTQSATGQQAPDNPSSFPYFFLHTS